MFENAKKNNMFLNAVVFELSKYRDVRHSRRILKILVALPDDVLDRNDLLKILFMRESLHAQTVKEGLMVCLAALLVCVRPI